MQQLTQQLRSGDITIQELPWPTLSQGQILVRNHYSLISAGTEGATAKTARKSLIGKIRERPKQALQVLDVLKNQGPAQTYRAVTKRLDAYSPVGYSSAGEVVMVGSGVEGFAVGDRVACAGVGYANHAEVISVPKNLCVKLPDDADLRAASYNALGSIAMQGVRCADVELGETCAVIGLGLIGQLTCLLLKAAGVRVVGIDVDSTAVLKAKEHSADLALERNSPAICESISEFTGGLGADAVIITAGSTSLDPINFAGEIARKKGTVVVVGSVPTGFDRDPHYYSKELSLNMSCSYGPGRYDPEYEEKGVDYPPAYARWTENRNMQSFQELLYKGSIDTSFLTTHVFPLDNAADAYNLILEKTEHFLGVLLSYGFDKAIKNQRIMVREKSSGGKVAIGFIGAGSYAQSNLLPNIPRNDQDVSLVGVMTSSGTTSKRVAEKFQFDFCTSIENDLLANEDINTLFIATRHDSHASYVLKGIESKRNIFVEKPLCLTEKDLDTIERELLSKSNVSLMVGFNRRFSPLAQKLKEKIGSGPISMIYRVNSGVVDDGDWIQDLELGGGRIIGEACHFIDFLTYICGSLPKRVYASALSEPKNLNDIVNINLEFENGSIGTISYFSNGSKDLPKEYIEIYRGGVTAILNDFKKLVIYGTGKTYRKKSFVQNKGQKAMVAAFLRASQSGEGYPIPLNEMIAVTRTTFKILTSLKTHEPQNIPNGK